jgi:nitrite reductase/ring-hydroxylating ferredoxin subunit
MADRLKGLLEKKALEGLGLLAAGTATVGGCWVLYRRLHPFILRNHRCDFTPRSDVVTQRRHATYPLPVPNTWYHLLDSNEVKPGKVHHMRALGRSLAVWRTTDGKPIVMDATCPHLGANLAVGGHVGADCITCPFHAWTFNSDGSLKDIPYLDKAEKLPAVRVNTYPAQDWCGLLCVYFHADKDPQEAGEPEFALPAFVEERISKWKPLTNWNLGNLQLLPTDWVDQSGDHSHFHTLHNHFLLPWTLLALPGFLNRMVSIHHQCATILGDSAPAVFGEELAREGGRTDKHYIYFTDYASMVLRGRVMKETGSKTLEMYVGPAVMVFDIPIHPRIGTINAFVTTTPCEGGSVMKVGGDAGRVQRRKGCERVGVGGRVRTLDNARLAHSSCCFHSLTADR